MKTKEQKGSEVKTSVDNNKILICINLAKRMNKRQFD